MAAYDYLTNIELIRLFIKYQNNKKKIIKVTNQNKNGGNFMKYKNNSF